mmetsp:Transcript_31525/g.69501  ORF Transcript_31525/g.69501 Transcript_31525/m.69501 type:complete len:223 (+) Transcript_31525:47-715(+)
MVLHLAAAGGAAVAHQRYQQGKVAAPTAGFHTYDPTASKHACPRRRDDALKAVQEERELTQILDTYDVNHTGQLEEDQVRCMMQDMNKGKEPTDEEVTFILRLCKAVSTEDQGEAIGRDKVLYAVKVWRCFLARQAEFRKKMAEFDTDKTGKLDKDQLRRMLISLNGGKAVKDSEVDWVMRRADILKDGSVNVMELLIATSAWYAYVDGDASGPAPKCCTIA